MQIYQPILLTAAVLPTTVILTACGQPNRPTSDAVVFDLNSFDPQISKPLVDQISQNTHQILKDHTFTEQFKTTTDTTNYQQIAYNINEFSLPDNLANDHRLGTQLMGLQLLHQMPSEFDLKTLLSQNNQLTKTNITYVIDHYHHIAPAFNWNTVAYQNAYQYLKKHHQTNQLITDQVVTYLTHQNFTNDQINNVLMKIVKTQQTNSHVDQNQLRQNVTAKNANNVDLAVNYIQGYLVTPQSKPDLYAHLINQNGFSQTTVDQAIKKIKINWNNLARLVAIQNQNRQPADQKYNEIQLANSVIAQHFTNAQALDAAKHVSNTSKEQNAINAALARINQKTNATRAALDQANRYRDQLKSMHRTSSNQKKYDQLAFQNLMQPYQKAYQKAAEHENTLKAFNQKTYPVDNHYNHALIIARYLISQLNDRQDLNPRTLKALLTNEHKYYHFDTKLSQKALQQAANEYQIDWQKVAKQIVDRQKNYLTNQQLKQLLQFDQFSDDQIQQALA